MALTDVDWDEELKRQAAISSLLAQPEEPPQVLDSVSSDETFTNPATGDIQPVIRPKNLADYHKLIDQVFPNVSPPPPEPADVQTDPETGTRYVQDPLEGKIPHAEIATEADKQAFRPSDATLPQIDVSDYGAVVPVRRGEEWREPWHPAGQTLQIPTPTPESPAGPVPPPPKPVPGFVADSQNALLNPAAGVIPPTPPPAAPAPAGVAAPQPSKALGGEGFFGGDLSQGPPGTKPNGSENEPYWPKSDKDISLLPPGVNYIDPRDQSQKVTPGTAQAAPAPSATQLPNAPLTPAPATQLPNAPVDQTKPVPLPNAPVTSADQTKLPSIVPAEDWQKTIDSIWPSAESKAKASTVDASAYANPDGTPFPDKVMSVDGSEPKALVIHYSGGSTLDSLTSTLKERGLGVEFAITPDGNLVQIGGPGSQHIKTGWGPNGTGLSNANVVGIEIVAPDENHVTPQQVETARKFAAARYNTTPVFGHNEVNPGHREPDEGMKSVAAIRAERAGATPPAPTGEPGTTPIETLVKLDQGGLNVTHFGYERPGESGYDPDSAAGHGKYVKDLVPGYDVALNSAGAKLVGNPEPGQTFQYAGREWRYGDAVSEKLTDARFDIYDREGTALTGAMPVGRAAAAPAGPEKQPWDDWKILPPDEQAAVESKIEARAQAKIQEAQATQQAENAAVYKLPEAQNSNIIGLYNRLETPVPDVSDQTRSQIQAKLKPEIIAQMRAKFPEIKTDDEAWAKAQSPVNALDVGQEWGTKALGFIQQFTEPMKVGAANTDQFSVDQFLNKAMPNASDADKHAYLAKLYGMPLDQRASEIAGRLGPGFVQPGNPYRDPYFLAQALDRLSDPHFQKRQADDVAKFQEEMKRNISSDPRLADTGMDRIVNDTAQIPAAVAAFSNPALWPIALGQVHEQVLEGFKKEHPEWDAKTLQEKATYATLAQFFGGLVAGHVMSAGAGVLMEGIEGKAQRAIAQAVFGGTSNAAIGGLTQTATNFIAGDPLSKGTGEATLSGLIQGTATSVGHAAGELAAPKAVSEAVPPPLSEQDRAELLGKEERPPVAGPVAEPVPPVRPASGGEQQQAQQPPRPFPTQEHANVFDDLVSKYGMDANSARTYVNRAQGKTEGEILESVQTQMRAETTADVPLEAHSDKVIEQRSIPPARTPQDAERGMTDEEAGAYMDRLNTEIERRHQARAGEVGLMPGVDHPEATVHENGDQPSPKFSLRATNKVSDFIDSHPILDKYPWAKDIPVTIDPDMRPMGRFIAGDTPLESEIHLKDPSYVNTLGHELNHLQQFTEGRQHGGSSATMWTGNRRAETLAFAKKLYQEMITPRSLEDYAKAAGFDSVEIARDSYNKDYLSGFKGKANLDRIWLQAQQGAGEQLYRNLSGEREARGEPPERYALGAEIPQKGLSVSDAKDVAEVFKGQFPHAPSIKIHGTREELPGHLQDAIAQHAGNNAVEALIHDGQIHVVAGENISQEALHRTLLEESIGHYGVEQVLGSKFGALLDLISSRLAGHPDFERLRSLYGNDPHTLAAEYIAKVARGEIQNPGLWTRIKAWFTGLARSLGFDRPFSDSELRVLLSRAKGRIEKGGGRSTVVTGEPRFRLRDPKEHETLRGEGFDKDRLKRPRGGLWYRSAYDEFMRNPETAPVAAALLHHVDRANELRGALTKPIRDALRGVKRREMPAILDGFSKILEAKDNKQPAPEGLHPKSYELWGAWQKSAAMVEQIAKDKILVYDRKLNGGKGAWRPFQAATDYVPRNVRREVIDAMRNRYNNPRSAKRWNEIVREFVDKGYAKTENEVLEKIKDAANLDTKHLDKKMGNLEKARTQKLPTSMYEYSLSGLLDYVRKASDRIAQVEAYGQKAGEHGKDLFERTAERINSGRLKGTAQSKDMVNYLKYVRNKSLGLDEPAPLGKTLATMRSVATAADLSNLTGALHDLIGSTFQTPATLGFWNTAKGYLHASTHFHHMLHEAEDIGAIHHDIASSIKEIDHGDESGSSLSDRLQRGSGKLASGAMKVSLREPLEKITRTITYAASKAALRDAVKTIRANPESAKAGAWAHFLARRGNDVSRLVEENGQGPESDRFFRRAVADTQAGYDPIQKSPLMDSPTGRFFTQYLSFAVNQTRNIAREIVLPLVRPSQKTVDITVNGKKYTVSDSRFVAAKRGIGLLMAGAATGFVKDKLKEALLGRISSTRDATQLAADIASDPDKSKVFSNFMHSFGYELMSSGMLGLVGNGAQILVDASDRQRFKNPLNPTVLSKLTNIQNLFADMLHEGQFDSHTLDTFLKSNVGAYRENKGMLARLENAVGIHPDVVKEEMTRQHVAELRSMLRRYNDEEGLGLKTPVFGDQATPNVNTPIARSIVDALYRGDAVGARKIFDDYVHATKDPKEQKARIQSLTGSIQASNPLKLGSTSNKDFVEGFWRWAQAGHNIGQGQIDDFRELMNTYSKTMYAAKFGKQEFNVPEKGPPVAISLKQRTVMQEALKQAIQAEKIKAALQPSLQH